jgi:hypothetical protein
MSVDVATNEPIVIHMKIEQTVRVELEEGVESLVREGSRVKARSVDAADARLARLRAERVVGESYDGYLRFHKSASVEDRALVERVNEARRDEYVALARKHGTGVAAPELLAGRERIAAAALGEVVEQPGGWEEAVQP